VIVQQDAETQHYSIYVLFISDYCMFIVSTFGLLVYIFSMSNEHILMFSLISIVFKFVLAFCITLKA
jgi:hypothetical protein